MALLPTHASLGLSLRHAADKVIGLVSDTSNSTGFSPEETLHAAALLDARLAPRTLMSNHDIDSKTLVDLGSIGMKRGKLVTSETHPELMQAWQTMAKRAGFTRAPQLIIAESEVPNAFTITKQEIAISTGLLKMLDFRETVAVLGHELRHAQSDHLTPRLFWTGLLGGAGALIANEVARATSLTHRVLDQAEKWKPASKVIQKIFGATRVKTGSFLGAAFSISTGFYAGSVIANRLAVRPTELDADAGGAAISGDPQALASALEKLQAHEPSDLLSKWRKFAAGYPTTATRIERVRALPGEHQPVVPLNEVHHSAPLGKLVEPAAELALS